VASVEEDRQPGEIGQNLAAVRRIVRFQHQPRHQLRRLLVTDVDDPRHREHGQPGIARRLQIGHPAESARSGFVDEDDIRLALDRDGDRVLCSAAIVEQELADQVHLRIRFARLDLAQVVDQQAVGRLVRSYRPRTEQRDKIAALPSSLIDKP
jgi:hypothetical protein